MYLLPAVITSHPSTAKFAQFLGEKNQLWLRKTAGSPKEDQSQLNQCDSFIWYSQHSKGISVPPQKSNFIAAKRTIVIAASGLNFEMLEEILGELSIDLSSITVEANAYHLKFDKMVVNIRCNFNEDDVLEKQIKRLCEQYFIDIFIKPNLTVERPGLAVFDMDSTLIEMECIDEIAKLAGVGDEVSAVTERAMQGEIAFSESLHYRVACLKEVELSALLSIRKRLPFMPGFTALILELKNNGWKVAIASGGFTYFADYIKALFDIDYAFSNTLEVKNNKLTGKVVGDIVDGQAKADILERLAVEEGIDINNTIAVGDGANDLLMLKVAGAGVAFKAKPKVQAQAANSIRFSGLEAILYLLG